MRPRRILFVELLGGLGDVAIALPALQALARFHPRTQMEALAFAPGAELLRHDPHLDAVHVAPRGRAREAMEWLLDREEHDLVVSTTATDGIGALIVGRAPRAVTDLWRDPPPDRPVGDRFLEILMDEGLVEPRAVGPPRLFLTPEEEAVARARLPEAQGPFAALLLDAGMAIKRWPEERFAALGRALRDRHGVRPLVVGGADPAAAPRVARAIGDGARALEPMPLRNLAAALGRCAVAVGADTGPLRLAALVGTPSAMLFGPSWRGRYGLGPGHASLQVRPSCPERRVDFTEQPCWYAGTCPLPTGPGSCVLDIEVREIEATLASLLARWSSPRGRSSALGTAPRGGSTSRLPVGRRGVRVHDLGPCVASDGPAKGTNATLRARRRLDGARSWERDWAHARRLLVLRLDNIGDVVMTGPALRAIRLSRPHSELGLLGSPSGVQAAPLLPWIDEARAERTLWQELGPTWADPDDEEALIERLRAGRWDGAMILTSFSQSPHPAALACRRAGIPLVAGASDEAGLALTHRLPKGDPTLHQAERNLALVRALGFGAGPSAMAVVVPERARSAARALLGGEGGHLLLAPWASASARQYEPARMAEAAARIADARGLRVVLTGAPADRGRGAALARRLGPAALDLTGRTSVAEAAALIEAAALVLCCNSSAMHLAEALGVPAVVLFAGTELASQWAPRRTLHRLVRRPQPCAPCHEIACPFGRNLCLDVEPARVEAAAAELVPGSTAGAGAP